MSIPADEVFRKTMSPERIKAARQRGEDSLAEFKSLQELRKALELTQVEIGKELGIGQEGVSRLERRPDIYLSTLRKFLAAMGGTLEMRVQFGNEKPVVLDQLFGEPPQETTAK